MIAPETFPVTPLATFRGAEELMSFESILAVEYPSVLVSLLIPKAVTTTDDNSLLPALRMMLREVEPDTGTSFKTIPVPDITRMSLSLTLILKLPFPSAAVPVLEDLILIEA